MRIFVNGESLLARVDSHALLHSCTVLCTRESRVTTHKYQFRHQLPSSACRQEKQLFKASSF